MKCPKCGGDIVVAPFGFMCANHKKDDKESCSFMIGSIASVRLKEAQVILKDVEKLKFVYFSKHDVVRHPLVQDIIEAYERSEEKRQTGSKVHTPHQAVPRASADGR